MRIKTKISRLFHVAVMVLCVASLLAPEAADAARRKSVHVPSAKRNGGGGAGGVNDARYADIIMDPVTGEVFHATNADALRYPASLTKMMTLYMLFEALAQNKTSMEARLDISDYAATMPQTNLALTPGDSIPVEIAIKALIVRSANDVAVVVAEALANDVDSFAVKMTNKARQLGMRNTVFKNPNGLPNTGQRTTARDMAKLGIALKRDFPQYYPMFETRQFSWEGVTYYTHNRVMLRYPGTDGIKTGFIGASGFNLVSSVVRGGRPLVGTVLGGGSGRWRDDRMIQLLDDGYSTIVSRGGKRGKIFAANLPLNRAGKPAGLAGVVVDPAALAQELATTEVVADADNSTPDAESPANTRAVAESTPFSAVKPAEPVAKPQPAPAAVPPGGVKVAAADGGHVIIVPKNTPPGKAPAAALAPVPAAALAVAAKATAVAPAAPMSAEQGWGIQVGAFSSEALAMQAVRQALIVAPKPLAGAQMVVIGPGESGAAVYRARLQGLNQLSARKACETLITNNSPCFIYAVGRGL